MFTCTLNDDGIIAIPSGPFNDMQTHIRIDFGNLLVFFRQSFLYISLEKHQTKFPTSSCWLCRLLP